MDHFYWLDQIQSNHRSLVGEEAFYLSQLLQQGYPILPGFVVSALALSEFLEGINWSEPLGFDLPYSSLYLDVDNPSQLQQVAQKICQEMISASLGAFWESDLESAIKNWHSTALILRPCLFSTSKTKTYFLPQNGLLESHVCPRTTEALILSLKQTWAQLFRAHSLFYWQRQGIQIQELNLAILVQPLWPGVVAGNLQTKQNTWTIQATWGQPHALDKGEVIPDVYEIHSQTGIIQNKHLGSKTLAYRLINPNLSGESPKKIERSRISVENRKNLQLNTAVHTHRIISNCLQAYLLSEDQQKQYALEEHSLNKLIKLAQNLKNQLNKPFHLEWVISLAEDNFEPELYITQINLQPSVILESSITQESKMTNKERKISFADEQDLRRENEQNFAPSAITIPNFQFIVKGLAASTGQVIAETQVISAASHNLGEIPSGKILVTRSIAPDWLPLLKNVAGIVAEQGGMTCHAAIIARELGIPAIVGAVNATQLIKSGESLLLDADQGIIYRANAQNMTVEKSETSAPLTALNSSYFSLLNRVPIATKLLVNLSQPSSIEGVASLPVDGVGLLRAELMILEILEGKHPMRWLQMGRQEELVSLVAQRIQEFVHAFSPRPVFYRSLDWRSHEFPSLVDPYNTPLTPEPNPMLGLRGTFRVINDPSLFDLELAALAQVQRSGYRNINLILPFVRTVEEFSFCRRRIKKAGLMQIPQFELSIMAEVPSILFLLPDYVKAGVQGISIGTNDLTQLLLGVDRDHNLMATAFDERHPAVIRAIIQLIEMSKSLGIPCGICGQAPSQYPELIEQLILHGITSISVEPNAFHRTYNAIARAEQSLLIQAVRNQINQKI